VSPASEISTSIRYGDKFVLTLFRKLEPGPHPSAELGEFLTEKHPFANTAPYAGALDYYSEETRDATVMGVLHGYVANEGDGWQIMRKGLADYMQRMQSSKHDRSEIEASAPTKFFDIEFALREAPEIANELIGPDLILATTVGKRLAEMHHVLSSEPIDPAFAPEPFNDFYRQGLYQGNIGLTTRRLEFARQQYSNLTPELRTLAEQVVAHESAILQRFRLLYESRVPSERTRFHGRMHLGHVLKKEGGDVVFFDFGGDPYLHVSERRIKRCVLRDVATTLMSFGYAAQTTGRQLLTAEGHEAVDRPTLRAWGRFWFAHVSAAFLRSYFRTVRGAKISAVLRAQQQILLDNYLLERAVLDIRPDIINKPDLASVPFRIILHLLEAEITA
jgi:maltose alpha-D-glucosyltransferase/alpha-amylase